MTNCSSNTSGTQYVQQKVAEKNFPMPKDMSGGKR